MGREDRVHHQASAIQVSLKKLYHKAESNIYLTWEVFTRMSPLLHSSLIFYTFKAHCHVSVLPCICCGRLIVALSLQDPSQLPGKLVNILLLVLLTPPKMLKLYYLTQIK